MQCKICLTLPVYPLTYELRIMTFKYFLHQLLMAITIKDEVEVENGF
jgi:hypothetical protein